MVYGFLTATLEFSFNFDPASLALIKKCVLNHRFVERPNFDPVSDVILETFPPGFSSSSLFIIPAS